MSKIFTKQKAKAIVANWLDIKPEAEFLENMYQILDRHRAQIHEARTAHIQFERDLEEMSEGVDTLLLGLIAARAVNANPDRPADSSRIYNLRFSKNLKALFFKKHEGGAS